MIPTSDDAPYKDERTKHLVHALTHRITEASDKPDYLNIEYNYVGEFEVEITIRRKERRIGEM